MNRPGLVWHSGVSDHCAKRVPNDPPASVTGRCQLIFAGATAQRAAEDNAIGLVDRLVDRHPHPEPRTTEANDR